MARTPQNFAHNKQLTTSAVSIIDPAPNNTTNIVGKLSFRNTSTLTRTVTVYVVETSGTANTLNELQVKSIPAGKDWDCNLIKGENLNTGISLQAKQDVGADVNINCSGTIFT